MGKEAKAVKGKSESFEKTLFKAANKPERFTCLDVAFKNNDQLKTNTALQMPALECFYRGENAKIELKI